MTCFKVLLFCLFFCFLNCAVVQKFEARPFILEHLKQLHSLTDQKQKIFSSARFSAIFEEHVDDVQKLLKTLKDDTDTTQTQDERLEIVQKIAFHMEFLQKLLNLLKSHSLQKDINNICMKKDVYNQLLYESLCHQPAKRVLKNNERKSKEDTRKIGQQIRRYSEVIQEEEVLKGNH